LVRAKGKKFTYVHTTYDYGNTRRIVLDKDVIGFQTGMLMRAYPIDKVIISSNYEDTQKEGYYERTENRRRQIIESVSGEKPEYLSPIAHLTKAELIDRIPLEFLKLAWYCRKPKGGRPCGTCITCKAVHPHFQNNRKK
jgi:7-cyano-7-deazaguanine synthase in queuosine biosynthesis